MYWLVNISVQESVLSAAINSHEDVCSVTEDNKDRESIEIRGDGTPPLIRESQGMVFTFWREVTKKTVWNRVSLEVNKY